MWSAGTAVCEARASAVTLTPGTAGPHCRPRVQSQAPQGGPAAGASELMPVTLGLGPTRASPHSGHPNFQSFSLSSCLLSLLRFRGPCLSYARYVPCASVDFFLTNRRLRGRGTLWPGVPQQIVTAPLRGLLATPSSVTHRHRHTVCVYDMCEETRRAFHPECAPAGRGPCRGDRPWHGRGRLQF